MMYIGIDPGQHTAIGIIDEDGSFVSVEQIDERKKSKRAGIVETWQVQRLHLREIGRRIRSLNAGDCVVVLTTGRLRPHVLAIGRLLGVVIEALPDGVSLVTLEDYRAQAMVHGHSQCAKEVTIEWATGRFGAVVHSEHMADALMAAEAVRRGAR
jgi:hypothetical protein